MNRSARATHRFGAGLTSLCGGLVMVIASVPFLFIGAATPYLIIDLAMVIRGVGVGFSFMPAMTAAFSSLRHDQINDASPQLNVLQRIGGSLGTAVIAVILQEKLTRLSAHTAHPSVNAVAASFAQTYWWVIGLTIVSLIPSIVLWRIERRLRSQGMLTDAPEEALMEVMA
jgi:NADH:ubiquinone oxidoreductase subunit 6 (subunit J)